MVEHLAAEVPGAEFEVHIGVRGMGDGDSVNLEGVCGVEVDLELCGREAVEEVGLADSAFAYQEVFDAPLVFAGLGKVG